MPIWRYDERLDQVTAEAWGATYVDDVGFRNILSSYFVWDHQAGRPFDEDDFLDGLLGLPSVSCSELLVHSVLAYGAVRFCCTFHFSDEALLNQALAELRAR